MFCCVAYKKTATNHRSKAPPAEVVQRFLALLCCHGICRWRIRL